MTYFILFIQFRTRFDQIAKKYSNSDRKLIQQFISQFSRTIKIHNQCINRDSQGIQQKNQNLNNFEQIWKRLQFQIKIQMGNECCQQQKVGVYEIDVSSKLRKQQFMLTQLPKDDPYLNQKIKQYKDIDTEKVMKHLNQQKYYWGQWQNGAPVGDGVLYCPGKYFYRGKFYLKPHSYGEIQLIQNGLKYKGEINDGKAEGAGTLTHKDGLYFYDGIWKNSQPVTGTLMIKQSAETDKKTIIKFDTFPMKQTQIIYQDGRVYFGSIDSKTLVPDGRGKVTLLDGTVYEGQWTEGLFHGEGVYSWPDGSSYEGSYQYGLKHGFGKYIYPSKKIYQGEWIRGLQHGRGTLSDREGKIIKKGIWNQGKFLTTDQI